MELVSLTLPQLDAVHRALNTDRLRFLAALPDVAASALLRYQTDQHARRSAPTYVDPAEAAARERNRQAVARYHARQRGDEVAPPPRPSSRLDGEALQDDRVIGSG